MSIGTIFLTVETSLTPGETTLAGQEGIALLKSAVAPLDALTLRTAGLDRGLTSELDAWMGKGVRQVLLIKEDRPLLTAESLGRLVKKQERMAAPWVTLNSPAGDLVAACADVHWLVEQIQHSPGFLSLEGLTPAAATTPADPSECLAVDSLSTLAEAECLLRRRINQSWMEVGVRMIDPATTYIDATVTIGRGTVILPNTHLWGETQIGESCRVGPNSMVLDSQIGDRCVINASVVEHAVMEDEADIGPFGHLRKGARMCHGAHMGNFGEMKNSTLGPNAKMGHFSYLGDATVGEDVNIGAGTVTCNYDGAKKHQTIIGEGAFIGSGSMLVAPLEIGAGAVIGAGSVVTHKIPAGAVAYGVPARVKVKAKEEEGKDSESGN